MRLSFTNILVLSITLIATLSFPDLVPEGDKFVRIFPPLDQSIRLNEHERKEHEIGDWTFPGGAMFSPKSDLRVKNDH